MAWNVVAVSHNAFIDVLILFSFAVFSIQVCRFSQAIAHVVGRTFINFGIDLSYLDSILTTQVINSIIYGLLKDCSNSNTLAMELVTAVLHWATDMTV